MTELDRRKLLQAGIATAIPLGGLSLLSGCGQSDKDSNNSTGDSGKNNSSSGQTNNSETNQTNQKEKTMQIQYLEIVSPEAEKLCKLYSTIHGITFGEPDVSLGSARTAKLSDGSVIAIRGPMRETETPVVRPYSLVDDLEKAVKAAKEAGAEIAIAKMEIPDHGTIAIYTLGGIECGLWQA